MAKTAAEKTPEEIKAKKQLAKGAKSTKAAKAQKSVKAAKTSKVQKSDSSKSVRAVKGAKSTQEAKAKRAAQTAHETVDEMISSASTSSVRRKSFLGNPNVHIIVDSPGDFNPDIVKALGVSMISFPYVLDGEEHLDDMFQSMSASDFYNAMRKGSNPSTSAVTPGRYYEVFKKAAERGVPTIYLAFPRALSSSVDNARQARDMILEEYPDFELYVVDDHLPCAPAQLLAIETVHQANLGMSAKELVEWIREARYFVRGLFTLESLDWLARGGRIPAVAASLGGKLDIKPELSYDETGALSLKRMCRGRKKALKAIINDFIAESGDERISPMAIVTADAEHDGDWLEIALRKVEGCEDIPIIRSSVGPVIGSHVGPGMVALIFWGTDMRKTKAPKGSVSAKLGIAKK